MGCCRKFENNIKKSNTSYEPKKEGFQQIYWKQSFLHLKVPIDLEQHNEHSKGVRGHIWKIGKRAKVDDVIEHFAR